MARGKWLKTEELTEITRLVALGHSDQAIADMIGRNRSQVSRHRRRMNIARPICTPVDDVPEAFAERAQGMSTVQVAKHFKVSIKRARKWFKATGVEYVRARSTKPYRRAPPVKAAASEIDQAISALRRRYPNVFRCDIRLHERKRDTFGSVRGLPDKGRNHWFVESIGIVDEAKVIELARQAA